MEAPAEGALAHSRAARQAAHGDGFAEVLQRPVERRRQRRARLGRRDRFGDELRLTAFAVRSDHQPPRHLVGDGRAVVLAHEVHAQVETGGAPGGGQEPAFVDVEHVRHELHARKPLGECPRVAPVGRRTQPVQKPGGGEDEGTRADRDQPCPAPVRAPQRGQHRCGNRLVEVAPPPRDDHCPCALDRAQPALNLKRHAALGAQRSALGGADLEIVPGHTQLGPAQGEDLDGDGELEGAEPVVGENGDGSVPGRHWQSIAEPWQNCQRRARAGDGRLGGYGRSTCRRCLRGLRSPKSRR